MHFSGRVSRHSSEKYLSLCIWVSSGTSEAAKIGMMQRNQQDQRLRSAKPTTVHGCAQSGDLVGIQKLLRDNPSLLNDRNPVVRSPL